MNGIPEAVPSGDQAAAIPRSKVIAVVAVLLAIGAVLRMFAPPIAGITPNFVIAMYCLAIVLVRPDVRGALAIGLVGGAVAMLFSKSPIPYLNLVSEPLGALACVLTVRVLPELKIRNLSLKPIAATAVGTLISGGLYVTLNFSIALKMPPEALLAAFIGVVAPVTVANAVIAQLLYAPSKSFLKL